MVIIKVQIKSEKNAELLALTLKDNFLEADKQCIVCYSFVLFILNELLTKEGALCY